MTCARLSTSHYAAQGRTKIHYKVEPKADSEALDLFSGEIDEAPLRPKLPNSPHLARCLGFMTRIHLRDTSLTFRVCRNVSGSMIRAIEAQPGPN